MNKRTDEGRYGILLMAADGTDTRQLPNVKVAARDPLWSADGALIAAFLFSAAPQNENDFTGVGIIEVASGEMRSFATDPRDTTFSTPAWSPIDTKLAFSVKHGESWDLFLLDTASGEIESLASTNANEWSGVWSPNGSKLAYIASSPDNALQANLVVLDLATSTRNVLLEGEPSISSMTWLDDSTLLLGVYNSAESATVFYVLGLGEGRMIERGRWAGVYLDPVLLP